MARKCDKCGRGPKTTISRSHSNIKTKQKQYPNLQIKRLNGKKRLLCVKCIKSLKKA